MRTSLLTRAVGYSSQVADRRVAKEMAYCGLMMDRCDGLRRHGSSLFEELGSRAPPTSSHALLSHLQQEKERVKFALRVGKDGDPFLVPGPSPVATKVELPDQQLHFLDDHPTATGLIERSTNMYFLGQDRADRRYCFAAHVGGGEDAMASVPQSAVEPLRGLTMRLSSQDAGIAGLANSMITWHCATRYCHRCGGGLKEVSCGAARACLTCKHIVYPRKDPVCIALIANRDNDSLEKLHY